MPDRRPPDDILCIALLEAYAPWLQPLRPGDGVAENVDAVELALSEGPGATLGVATPSGSAPLPFILQSLPKGLLLFLQVRGLSMAQEAVRLVRETENSHRTTLIARGLSILRAAKQLDRRITLALMLTDPETAKEAAHRGVVDALVCSPEIADDELMVLSWQRRVRVYVGVVDRKADIVEWIERGADGIRTRRPDLYLQALGPVIVL